MKASTVAACLPPPQVRTAPRIALLGYGRIGAAVARLAHADPSARGTITAALVRRSRPAEARVRLVENSSDVFRTDPDVIVEALGGVEPARTLILEALTRGIPVVTANKSVIARHGDELVQAAERAGVALRCEATVVAGVPFVTALGARPFVSSVSRLVGVLNGTTAFILSRMETGAALDAALEEARNLGLAEPDASNDLDGTDVAEKLCVLVRHAWRVSIQPDAVERTPLTVVQAEDLALARDLGGRLRPVGAAVRSDEGVSVWSAPAFLPEADPLAHLSGAANGLRLERAGWDSIHFTGPGAGPEVTARTLLDDVHEVHESARPSTPPHAARVGIVGLARSAWFVTLRGPHVPEPAHVADLLAARGVWPRQWSARRTETRARCQALITFPCARGPLTGALGALAAISGCTSTVLPVVEAALD